MFRDSLALVVVMLAASHVTGDPTTTQRITNCTHNDLSILCPPSSIITIDDVIYGRAQRCRYTPQQCHLVDGSLHTCTGRRRCHLTAVQTYIPHCGPSTYMSLSYHCVTGDHIDDLCSTSEVLTSASGYLISPGYPSLVAVPSRFQCSVVITQPPGWRINIHLVDFRQVKVTSTCVLNVMFQENYLSWYQDSASPEQDRVICLDTMLRRNKILFSSDTNSVRVMLTGPKYIYNQQDKAGLLMHYEGLPDSLPGNHAFSMVTGSSEPGRSAKGIEIGVRGGKYHSGDIARPEGDLLHDSRNTSTLGNDKVNLTERSVTDSQGHSQNSSAVAAGVCSLLVIITLIIAIILIIRRQGNREAPASAVQVKPTTDDDDVNQDDTASFSSWSTAYSISSACTGGNSQPMDYQNIAYSPDDNSYPTTETHLYEQTYIQPLSSPLDQDGKSNGGFVGRCREEVPARWSVNEVVYDEPCPALIDPGEDEDGELSVTQAVRQSKKILPRPSVPPPHRPQPKTRTGRKPMPPPKPQLKPKPAIMKKPGGRGKGCTGGGTGGSTSAGTGGGTVRSQTQNKCQVNMQLELHRQLTANDTTIVDNDIYENIDDDDLRKERGGCNDEKGSGKNRG